MDDDLSFAVFLETAIPRGSWIVSLYHAYFDESGTDATSKYMTMAGYIFTSEQAVRFSRDWGKILKQYKLPYAHMKDAVCGNGPYKHLGGEDCDKINRLLIEHIKRRTLVGFSVVVDKTYYDSQIGNVPGFPTAYSFCVLRMVHAAAHWAEKKRYEGSISYFFEAGHAQQSEANIVMNQLAMSPQDKRNEYRYLSHSFFRKADAPPLQAADMLAWQINKHVKDNRLNNPRADFRALVRPWDFNDDHSEANLAQLKETWEQAGLASVAKAIV